MLSVPSLASSDELGAGKADPGSLAAEAHGILRHVDSPNDADLKFAQVAVRLGAIQPQDLPRLMQEIRELRARSGEDNRKTGLGQLLVRKKLVTVSDYLVIQREVEKKPARDESAASLRSLEKAIADFGAGTLDGESFEKALSSEDVKIEMPSREEMPPSFGRYELLAEIARGGMGIVYRAKDTQNGAILALKVMIEADEDEARLQRFEREAELAKALDHPGIVKVYDAGTIDGMPYFTMDLVDGKSFDDMIEEGVDRLKAIEILAQTARAVDHAHKRGIVHRDLKPGNVLVEKGSGRARVTDFGLARDMDRNTRITRVGQAVGTPYYMAPEQVRGERDVDGRADTYAIGVMLYEVLTGDVPFDADSALTLFKKIDREPVNLPLDPARGIDQKIHAIAMRALQKKREDRYASSKLLADDLERYLKGARPRAKANTGLDDVALWISQHRRGVALAAVIAAALAAVSIGAVAILLHLAQERTRERGRREAQAAVERASGLVEQGEGALLGGDGDAALAARRAMAELERIAELSQGDGPRAEGAREAAQKDVPVRRKALWLLGRALDATGQKDEARSAIEEASRIAPAEPAILRRLGELRHESGDEAGAAEAFGEAVQLDARDALARVERGEAEIEGGESDAAVADLSEALRLIGSEDKGPAKGQPLRMRALLLRSRAYVEQALHGPEAGRQNAISAAKEDALAAHDVLGTVPEPLLALAAVERARATLEPSVERALASLRTALEACAQALVTAPACAAAFLARGDILLAHGELGRASEAYDDAVRTAPRDRDWEERLGRALVRAQRFELDDARADLETAARHAELAPLALGETVRGRLRARERIAVELATVLVAQGDAGGARAVLDAAVARGAQGPLALVALADLELAAGARDAALGHVRAAVPLAPAAGLEAARVHEALARIDLAANDKRAALQEATVAAALAGRRPDARVRRALALVHAKTASSADESERAAALELARVAWSEAFLQDLDTCERGRPRLDLASRLLVIGAADAALACAAPDSLGRAVPRVAASAQERLEAVLRLDPLRVPALVALGGLELSRGHAERALALARSALEADPYAVRAHEVAAEALLAAKDGAAAAEEAARALAGGDTPYRRLLAARAYLAAGDGKLALEAVERARALPLDDAQTVEVDALAAEAAGDAGAADRVRAERREARARLLAEARTAETTDPEAARARVQRLVLGRGAALSETRAAIVLWSRLAGGTTVDRIEACARALVRPDPAALDGAHRVLAAAWSSDLPPPAALVDLAKRADEGDTEAAVAVALVRIEDSLARRPGGLRPPDWLVEPVERGERAVPESLVPRIARVLVATAAGDLGSADAEMESLRAAAPGSALVLEAGARLAFAHGDRDVARDLESRAQSKAAAPAH